MKSGRWIVFGLLGLVLAVGLNGCIISASPDNQLPITIDSGDKIDFAVTCSGGPNICYHWYINDQEIWRDILFFQGTSKYTFSPSTPGEYTITCKVHEYVVLPFLNDETLQNPPPSPSPELWRGQHTWEIEVVEPD